MVDAAREEGSRQVLDTALWILSLTELSGGSPRRAGAYIEQVRELRRAIGYNAEQVVNAAYLAWIGAPRGQVEALARRAGAAGWGGVQSAAVAALAVRDLAEGHYRDAYHRLRAPGGRSLPPGHPAAVPGLRRGRHQGRALSGGRALREILTATGGGERVGVGAGRGRASRALITPDDQAEPLYRRPSSC